MVATLAGEKTSQMDITFPLSSEVCLKIGQDSKNGDSYPTSRLQKGLVLIANGQELVEEGVGFGVPVLKFGVKTIFPGAIELAGLNGSQDQELTAVYRMNLEEKLIGQNLQSVQSRSLYRIKNHLADVYRHIPATRRPLTAMSNALRLGFGWRTTFEEAGCNYPVKVHYVVDRQAGIISVVVDTADLPQADITEVVVMNEQGARYFDTYSDSSGAFLQGEAIGSWDEVTAESASFVNPTHRLAFTVPTIAGARLFRGRELIGSRLAWSGFGYSFPPTIERIGYQVRIERLQ